ncbi:hypothetical protein P7K49_004187 [Saguinus oedipus]|uniref:Uncharacterized protein n=1 Tax=Saguinus oedipus TaxID=9490 RepID=A0ABQ9W6N5_SAGOE|nr:hypothetical protein P7K49_004187 [Saguinus oedipus]
MEGTQGDDPGLQPRPLQEEARPASAQLRPCNDPQEDGARVGSGPGVYHPQKDSLWFLRGASQPSREGAWPDRPYQKRGFAEGGSWAGRRPYGHASTPAAGTRGGSASVVRACRAAGLPVVTGWVRSGPGFAAAVRLSASGWILWPGRGASRPTLGRKAWLPPRPSASPFP